MAGGRDCIIFTFPMLGTLAAIVLSIVAFIGTSPKASGLNNSIYFMRLDFTNITVDSVSGLPSSISSLVDSEINAVVSQIGLPDFYDVGGTGYCQGTMNGSTTSIGNCSTPMVPFWFDLVSILEAKVLPGVSIDLPSNVKNYEKILHGAGVAMWVCYVVGIVLSGVELFIGILTFHSRLASVCAGFVGAAAALVLVLASALATGIYVTYRKYFNEQLSSFGVVASLGTDAYVITWVGTAASMWAALWWIFTICCGSTRRSSHREVSEEKEPFIGYVPYHH